MAGVRAWVPVLFAALGGLLTGYSNSSISGILEMRGFQNNFPTIFPKEFSNGTDQRCSSGDGASEEILVGLIVSMGNVGGISGAVFAGRLSDIFSRRLMLATSGLFLMFGSSLLAASLYNYIWMIFLGRTIIGVTIGFLYVLMPIYIGEMAPQKKRGLMISFMGPGYSIGVLIGLLTNVGFERFDEGWRVACAVLAVGGLIYTIGFLWLPYTPRWLVMKNRKQEAFAVFSLINQNSTRENFVDTYIDFEDLKEAKMRDNRSILKQFMRWKYIRRFLLMIGLFGLGSQMMTLVAYYPVTLFCLVGVSQPFIISIVLGPINTTAAVLSSIFIDKMGRKVSLIVSGLVNLTASLIAGALLHIYGSENSAVNYIIVVLICIYSFFIFYSWTIVPWIIVAESFPLRIRGIATSMSNSFFALFLFSFNFITPRLLGPPLHIHGYLYLTAVFNFMGAVLVLLGIPETKGVSLECIDEIFSRSWIKRIGCDFSFSKQIDSSSPVLGSSNLLSDIKLSQESKRQS